MYFIKQLVKNIFQYEARLVLKKYNPKIIAITGSVGKTATKDILYSLLSKKFFVRKSEKSFTTELGIPLTILGCSSGRGPMVGWLKNIILGFILILKKNNYPDFLILEIDGDKPNDILKISKWISPDIVVITAIGNSPSHIESFGSNIVKFLDEKRKLLDALGREGVVFYNADDENTKKLVSDVEFKKISCGLTEDCDFFATNYEILSGTISNTVVPTGISFDIVSSLEKNNVKIMGTIGVSNEYAVLLSVAVASHLGISIKESVPMINKVNILPGRMKIISGIKDTTIIDDTYNSSPIAVKQAVDSLGLINTSGRKIAVMGDMLELGKFSTDEHRIVARSLQNIANYVICVGLRAKKGIAEELLSNGFSESNIYTADTPEEAGKFLQELIKSGDVILIKGSQSMRMEKVVEEVMRHPEDKNELLVRQEPEWIG